MMKNNNLNATNDASAPKGTRVESAYHRLKAELRSNRMPSGFTAPETEIATQLGMSRTPVREALIRLEAEGVIELIPRRGMRVLPIAITDMEEIYEILAALEPEAAANLAATKPSVERLAPMEEAVCAMERALEKGDLEAWALGDDQFHSSLMEIHGNRRMTNVVTTLFDQAHRARMVTLQLRQAPVLSTREHREIFKHLCAGDPIQTREIFRAHRQRAKTELLTLLNRLDFAQL